jgi:hypothetical protein
MIRSLTLVLLLALILGSGLACKKSDDDGQLTKVSKGRPMMKPRGVP